MASSDNIAASSVANGGTSLGPTRSTDFKLRDPRTVFHDFFGGKDPFSEVFGIPGNLSRHYCRRGNGERACRDSGVRCSNALVLATLCCTRMFKLADKHDGAYCRNLLSQCSPHVELDSMR